MTINPSRVKYTPPSSLGREIGITFAFIGAFIVTIVLYALAWRVAQHRTHKEDIAHRQAFLASIKPVTESSIDSERTLGTTAAVSASKHRSYTAVPVTFQRARAQEIVFDRYGSPENRAELPVHSRVVSDVDKERIRQNASIGSSGRSSTLVSRPGSKPSTTGTRRNEF